MKRLPACIAGNTVKPSKVGQKKNKKDVLIERWLPCNDTALVFLY